MKNIFKICLDHQHGHRRLLHSWNLTEAFHITIYIKFCCCSPYNEDIQLQRANQRKWLKVVTEEQRQGNYLKVFNYMWSALITLRNEVHFPLLLIFIIQWILKWTPDWVQMYITLAQYRPQWCTRDEPWPCAKITLLLVKSSSVFCLSVECYYMMELHYCCGAFIAAILFFFVAVGLVLYHHGIGISLMLILC